MAGALEGDTFIGPKAEVSNKNLAPVKIIAVLIKVLSYKPNFTKIFTTWNNPEKMFLNPLIVGVVKHGI